MTKLTVNKPTAAPVASPSAQAIASATAEVSIQDAKGRKILLRRPGVLAQFRLVEALGPTASNRVYVNMCLPLIYVAAIDDDDRIPMTTKREIEALIQRLDEEGIAAVSVAVEKHYGEQTPEEDKAKLGN